MGGEVVQDHDISLVQGRGQLGFDVEVEEFPVYRPADDPRRVQPIMAQCGDEGLGLPMAKGRVIDQTRSAWGPSSGLGPVGLERSSAGVSIPRIDPFSRIDINKCQPCQHVAHEGLPVSDPDLAGQCHIRPLLLDRPQVFFCVSGQGRASAARPSYGGPRRPGRHATPPPVHQGSGHAFP